MIRFGTTRKAPTEDEACLGGGGGGKNGWRICVTTKGICTDVGDMDGFFV